jgi:hypothetical protein
MELRHRFDLHLNDEVKKFLWILATLLDPRFKKLDFFKGCEDLTSPDKRTRYAAGLRIEYNKHYKNKVFALAEASGPASHAAGSSASGTAVPRKRKRDLSHLLTSSQVRTRRMTLMTQCSPAALATLVLTKTSLRSTWPCRRLRTTESAGQW